MRAKRLFSLKLMARAKRHFIPGYIWHITHRCHKREFLLKFSRDRHRYLQWLYQARKRYGLKILNYMVTSNHIHLLVVDDGDRKVVPNSMQLVAGRTGQEFNQRKNRNGAYWEDRYHATAVETERYLLQCLVYIDLNMVRAGVVKHPAEWPHSGYLEIQQPPERYRVVDLLALSELCGFDDIREFQKAHREWVEAGSSRDTVGRDDRWSESIAVGSESFVEQVKTNWASKHNIGRLP